MYRNASYYITSPASGPELHEAFDCGFLMAMKIFRHAVPVNGDATTVSRWIAQKATLYELETSAQARQNACKLLDSARYDVNEMRAMLFDVAQVNNFGMEVDENGPIYGEDGELLEGATHREWPLYCYCDREGRQVAGMDADPDTMKAKGCRRVRYFEIYDRESGTEIYRVTSDDEVMVQELLRRDIAANSQIAFQYICESRPDGPLEDYMDAIREMTKGIPLHCNRGVTLKSASAQVLMSSDGRTDNGRVQEEWCKDDADICALLVIWIAHQLKSYLTEQHVFRYEKILSFQRVRRQANEAWREALKEDLEWLLAMTEFIVKSRAVQLTESDATTINKIYARLLAAGRAKTYTEEDGLH